MAVLWMISEQKSMQTNSIIQPPPLPYNLQSGNDPRTVDITLTRNITISVKDASLTRTYSFLPASWAGDTHKETNFLPIGDREEKEERCLNRRTDSLETA